ncbi:ABC transporter permease [Streptomonospora salina]|uniref:Transport permease protein n=1 Tax=Streptomonospora salina TaxID=104205 RepID=A0A841EJM0_9ACTN|nr:ABC transporter permease [Streptomonospora salina]MBB6000988.1 ABC-2 type transport system permease protein [Streptomonospora salina]
MRALYRITAVELTLFLRDPAAYFWTLIFPVALVAIIGIIPSAHEFSAELGGRVIDYYTPVALVTSYAFLGLFVTPGYLVGYREKGVLRRLSTTPVGPARVLTAQLSVQTATAVVTTVLVLGMSAMLWDVELPDHVGGFLLAFLLSVTAILAIGSFLAAVVPTSKAVNAMGSTLFFPLMFFAGLYVPTELLPAPVPAIADFTPLGAAVEAFGNAAENGWPGITPSAVLAGYAAVFGLAAARFFRWE